MQLRCACLVLALGGLSITAQEPISTPALIDGVLLRPKLWESTAGELAPDLEPLQFAWISTSQDVTRSVLPGLAFQNRPIEEVILTFRAGKLAEVRLLYFSRGDSAPPRKDQFEGVLADITAELSALTGRQPVERGRDSSSAVKAEGRLWDTGQSRFLLEWSSTKGSHLRAIAFRAEFIRLTMRPSTAEDLLAGAAPVTSRETVKRFVARDHVERLAGGDVKLKDISMVDQGEKGYCVVASVERVLRYYGVVVDQHELAQIANSDREAGTSMGAMLASFRRLSARLGVKVRSLYEWNTRDFLKLIDNYNRATKRGKLAPEIKLSGQLINIEARLARMNPKILKEVRLKSGADFERFKRDIQRSIDEGIPRVWSVRLGMVEEEQIPQAVGGHMRLIIGYNSIANEVLYSDSWGLGHEEKRMSLEDAWTMTNGLSSLQPIS